MRRESDTGANQGIVELLPEHHLLYEMQDIHHLIARRAYKLFAEGGFIHGHDLEDWLSAERELLHSAPMELHETDSQFYLRVEVPGFRESEIVVAVGPLRVIISAEHQADAQQRRPKILYSECLSYRVFRSFNLPAPINPRKTARRLSNGVLEITLPKSEVEKSGRLAA